MVTKGADMECCGQEMLRIEAPKMKAEGEYKEYTGTPMYTVELYGCPECGTVKADFQYRGMHSTIDI